MRTTRDRIRHALLFEVIALLIITPLGAVLFGFELHEFGAVALICALVAMIWNYLFNLGFDHASVALRGTVTKTLGIRVLHAVMFEAGLLVALVPFIVWFLGVSLVEALVMDIAISGFFLVYAFVFNWAYDVVFPMPVRER